MLTKQQLLDSISSKVVAMGDIAAIEAAAVSANKAGPKLSEIPRPGGGRIETWDVPVTITVNKAGDHTINVKQRITVIYNGDNTEAGATLSGSIRENYTDPVAKVNANKEVLEYLMETYGVTNGVPNISFCGTSELADGLKAGIFQVPDGSGGQVKIAITKIPGESDPIIVPYAPL